jgi:inosine-uridine nucleoside N-ribohydrolase
VTRFASARQDPIDDAGCARVDDNLRVTTLVLLLALLAPGAGAGTAPPERERVVVVVDADTANEIDDLYAIVRALREPRFEVVGLTSAQWHGSREDLGDTLARSQELNEALLRRLGMERVPHPPGAHDPLPDATTPRDSPAARHIVARALETPPGKKLTVLVLGSFTNLASALLLDPRVIPRIRAFVIGLKRDPVRGEWSLDEFNSNNDRNAVRAILDTPGLDLTVMTATTSEAMVFDRGEVDRFLGGRGAVEDFLVARWQAFAPDRATWIMWDVALVEAVAVPSLATLEEKDAPPGHARRRLPVYTGIDVPGMKSDYWRVLRGEP